MKYQVFVNENKYTVAVKAKDAKTEYLIEFCNFYKRYNIYPDMNLFDEFLVAYGKQIDKMIGIATCNVEAGDNFNVVFGEALARERFLKVFETYRIRMYEMIYGKLDKMREYSDTRWSACFHRRLEREDKIEEMITEVE